MTKGEGDCHQPTFTDGHAVMLGHVVLVRVASHLENLRAGHVVTSQRLEGREGGVASRQFIVPQCRHAAAGDGRKSDRHPGCNAENALDEGLARSHTICPPAVAFRGRSFARGNQCWSSQWRHARGGGYGLLFIARRGQTEAEAWSMPCSLLRCKGAGCPQTIDSANSHMPSQLCLPFSCRHSRTLPDDGASPWPALSQAIWAPRTSRGLCSGALGEGGLPRADTLRPVPVQPKSSQATDAGWTC